MTYTTLIDVETVRVHLEDARFVAIDCRHALADFSLGRKLYDESHLPGAFFASIESDLAGAKNGKNGRHPLPDPEVFASFLRSCGVNDDTQIVAYDAGGDMFAARLWLLARWIGHSNVAVLDGGIAAWKSAGFPTTSAVSTPRVSGSLHVKLHPELVVDASYVLAHLRNDAMQVIDARAADRFAGQNETVDPIAGHIPGAKNRPFKENFGEDLLFKSPAELRAHFEALGDTKSIVHQCGSGVSAAVNNLAMEHAGLHGSRIYAGSWSEWIADPSRPLATGP